MVVFVLVFAYRLILRYNFISYKSQESQGNMDAEDSILYMIPRHYTELLQPCDVVIKKSQKDRLKKAASK